MLFIQLGILLLCIVIGARLGSIALGLFVLCIVLFSQATTIVILAPVSFDQTGTTRIGGIC